MKDFQPLIYAVDAENITIQGQVRWTGRESGGWNFRVMIDLRDNGMRNVE